MPDCRASSTGSGSIPSTASPSISTWPPARRWRPNWPNRAFATPSSPKSGKQENAEGLQGGWDANRRDQELDADGVVGEVIFPDADAVTGGASAPFGAGLGSTAEVPIDLLMAGAKAHNRWLAELCSDSPHRRAGVAIVPIFDVDAAVTEIRRARESGLRGGILIPSMWQPYEPYNDAEVRPGLGRLLGARDAGPRPLGRRRSGVVRRARRDLRRRGALVVDPTAVVPPLGGDLRAISRPSSSSPPSAAPSGPPTSSGPRTSSTTESTRPRSSASN